MEKRIKERYSNAILEEAMQRYGIAEDSILLLDGFESFMYEFDREEEVYILRIGHSFRRSESLIRGEVDWINFLSEGGAPVAKAIRSENGKLVEPIDDGNGEYFLVTAFIKAKGKPSREVGWTSRLFETYGKLLGRMHALSKGYRLIDITWKRPHWNDPLMLEVEKFLHPVSEVVVVERFRTLMDHLRMLSKDDDSYGLIHQDAHAENLYVDETGNITLFDFDDCAYSWFIYDIAVVLFYMVMGRKNVTEFTHEFMFHFIKGYKRENQIKSEWLKEIPHFFKLREIDLYAVIHRSFDVKNLDDPWCIRYMDNRRYKIEHDVPYIDFDFKSLAEYI